MASICGIRVKGLTQFRGHEGEPLFQGDLFLNGEKIGFWSQDAWGGPDNFRLDKGYRQVDAINKALSEMYPEKAIHGVSYSGEPYTIEYDLERLMFELVGLIEDEQAYQVAVNEGYKGIMVATDGVHQTVWKLPGAYTALTAEALMDKMADEICRAKKGFCPEDEYTKHEVKIYRSSDDFVVGKVITLDKDGVEQQLADAGKRSRASENERHPSEMGKDSLGID